MRIIPAVTTSAWCALLLLAAVPASAQITYGSSGSADFSVTNQNMWGNSGGGAVVYSHMLGTGNFSASGSVGAIVGSPNTVIIPGGCVIWCWDPVTADTRTGGIMSGSVSGNIGVEFGTRINPGNVDIAYGLDASVTTSDMSTTGVGDVFSIGSTYALDGGQIQTEFASFEAWMDLHFRMAASASTTLCFTGSCESWGGSLFNVDVTQELLSLNRGGSGTLQVLGLDVPTFNFGEEIGVGPVGVTVTLPNIETTGGLAGEDLASSGGTDLLKVGVDVPRTILDYAAPGAGCILSCGAAGFGYSVFSSSLGPVLGLQQDFLFDATPMMTLVFDEAIAAVVNGVTQTAATEWSMPLGQAMDFIFPAAAGVNVTPYYWLNNSLTVATDLTVALDLDMSALELFSPIGSIGPLWEDNLRTDALALNVDTRSFGVDFGQVQGGSFYMETVVPEPITLILFGSGLMGVGGAAMKRRRREEEEEELA